ncbi:MAG: ABC transporter ATP-binding protein [Candidatus Aminicenantes bacterium]|nr:ABC transporter ATP-binding protein [Candidatus Aminicenantes bacterium]
MSLRVRNLVFRYRAFELRVGGLAFEESRLTVIVGPNGAGKTTFLKCLAGLLPVPKGAIDLDGRDLVSLGEPERARRLAFVPQEHGAAFNYSVLDFVLMGRTAHLPLFASPSAEDVRIAEEALSFVGFSAYASRPHFQLSSGERRMVLIARALAQQTDLLVLDEPTTFLDPRHEAEVMDLARKLAAERRKTVVMTLHNLDLAVRSADEMVFMKNGRVVSSGRPEDVLTENLLTRVYDFPMTLFRLEGRTFVLR